jgi:hypothetical protein
MKKAIINLLQPVGFISIIVYLNAYWIIFADEMRVGQPNAEMLAAGWLASFAILSGGWVLLMKKMNWSLPKAVRETHQ